MSSTTDGPQLRAGEIVRVRTQAEILASLDADGRLDRLPFMPEMLQYCGRTLRVYKRADKTCDSIWSPGMLRLRDTVLLWGARCDGTAHGDCQSGCLIFWKEAWLERSRGEQAPAAPSAGPDLDALMRSTSRSTGEGVDVYSCQATELRGAAEPLPRRRWWDVRQYVEDVRSGNAGFGRVVDMLGRRLRTSLRYRTASVLDRTPPHGRRSAATSPAVGTLQPGDRVVVRSREEIAATLDASRRNKGLSFYAEMERYCRHEFRVLRRVERLVHEQTGALVQLRDCLVLDDVICQGDFHALCPRAVYPFWREAWLRKLD